jgi:hypothetical protein
MSIHNITRKNQVKRKMKMKFPRTQLSILLITIIVASAILAIPIQLTKAATITFECTAKVTTDNAGVGLTAHYTVMINNTGSAKLGNANFSIPAGYTNLIASSIKVTNTAGQVWTASVLAYPTLTSNGTVSLWGSSE